MANEREPTPAEARRCATFEKTSARMAEQGWRREDLTVDIPEATKGMLLAAVPFVVVLLALYLLLNPLDLSAPTGGVNPGMVLASLVAFVAATLVLAAAHEAIHGLVWGICAKQGFRAVEFGFIKEYLTPYCTCTDPLGKWQYVLGAAMPTVALGIAPAAVAAFVHNPLLLAIGLAMVLGGGGDMLVIYKLLGHHAYGETVYYDHPCECGIVAFVRGQATQR